MPHLEPSPLDEFEEKKWPWWFAPLAVIPFFAFLIIAAIVPKLAVLLVILAFLWVGTALAVCYELGKQG